MISFCQTHGIAHDVCGKVVVATTDKEVQALDQLASRGNKNGLHGLKYLSSEELEAREPFVRAKKALLAPEEGIVDYSAVMKKMVTLIQENRGQVSYNTKVSSIDQLSENEVVLSTSKNINTFDYLVSCTGLWSDKTYTNLTQQKPPLRIVPFRGEYLKFKQGFEDRINHLVYPVPDAQFPFLGVHFTRMVDGSREVGPNAVLALKREGYSKSSFSLKDSYESLTYPGLLRFVGNNFNFSVSEFKSSLFMKDFIAKAQKMIPDVHASMLETGPAGVRAQAISKEGKLQMDFNIIRRGRQIHVLNAPSPGATASLAIASHIIENYLDKH
jgi:L-2-hydroxyglutarate oxidase